MTNGGECLTDLSYAGALFMFFFMLWMFSAQFLNYIFHAFACSKIMQSRKMNNPFLAWLPIGGNYSLGKICDDINNKNNKKSNFKVLMTIFSSCLLAMYTIFFIIYKLSTASGSKQAPNSKVFAFLLLAFFVICTVFYLMSINCIFKEFCSNSSKYFALSLIFTIIPIAPFVSGLMLVKAAKNSEYLQDKT